MIAELVPTKPDQEVANEIKNKLAEVYAPLLKVLDDAKDAGFYVQVQTGLNGFGKNVIMQLIIAKHF